MDCGGITGRKNWPHPRLLPAIPNSYGNGTTGAVNSLRPRSRTLPIPPSLNWNTESKNFGSLRKTSMGLHPLAGSQRLSEIHGNIWKVRCTQCEKVTVNRDVPIAILPECVTCRGLLRPHIVWFGESLDPEDLQHSSNALRNCDVLLIIGTSGVVYPAASFGPIAKENGAFVAELNLDPTPNSGLVDGGLPGPRQRPGTSTAFITPCIFAFS